MDHPAAPPEAMPATDAPPGSSHLIFAALVAVQVAASQFILWTGLPVYRRLMTDSAVAAGARDVLLAIAATVVMQAAYWLAFRVQQRLVFRRRVLLGHVLLFLGEVSFFFASALAAVVLFERSAQPHFVAWKVLVLVAILFASFCLKHQLETLGRRMAETD